MDFSCAILECKSLGAHVLRPFETNIGVNKDISQTQFPFYGNINRNFEGSAHEYFNFFTSIQKQQNIVLAKFFLGRSTTRTQISLPHETGISGIREMVSPNPVAQR